LLENLKSSKMLGPLQNIRFLGFFEKCEWSKSLGMV